MKKILFGISALATVSCLFTTACQNPPAPTEKAKLDVICTGCTIEEQKEFLHIYTLNYDVTLTVVADQDFILPDDVDAKIGDKQLVKDTDYTYSKDSGELKFTIKGDTTITITAQSEPKPKEELNDYTWAEIKEISDSGTASELFKVGDTKDIVVNGQTHQVRIIGFDQDYADPNDKEGTKIGITFEFVNILSDENGYSLAAYWNDIDEDNQANYSYSTSTIRAVLNGEGGADINWFQYFGTDHDDDTNKNFSGKYSGKSVLNDMLPDDLKAVLTAPCKLVYEKIYNSSTQAESNANWSEMTIKDKLFLLSPREIGEEDEQIKDPSTFTYDFYKSDNIYDIRKKQQIRLSGARETSLNRIDLEGKYICTEYGDYPFKISMAGVNEDDAGYYWLRSPNREGGYGDNCAWGVDKWGLVGPHGSGFTGNEVFLCASGLAPAFCV